MTKDATLEILSGLDGDIAGAGARSLLIGTANALFNKSTLLFSRCCLPATVHCEFCLIRELNWHLHMCIKQHSRFKVGVVEKTSQLLLCLLSNAAVSLASGHKKTAVEAVVMTVAMKT